MFSGRFKLHDTCYQHKVRDDEMKITLLLSSWTSGSLQGGHHDAGCLAPGGSTVPQNFRTEALRVCQGRPCPCHLDWRQSHWVDPPQWWPQAQTGKGYPQEDQQAGPVQVCSYLKSLSNRRHLYSQIAEITGDLDKSDQQIEEELGSNLAVARTVIDYGQKNKNPMVGWYSSRTKWQLE